MFNVMELFAKLGLDTSGYDEGLEQAGKKASVFGDVLKADLVSKGIDVAIKGMTKLGSATINMVEQSVSAFADYEQLVGGIETLFEDLSYDVIENADNAFKTAGLSTNEYLETVMGFSAALTSSLQRQQGNIRGAAEKTDQIIVDMADTANKMGVTMESVQNAYSGFARGQYMMLDSLKLGYGGTKEEMEKLLEDAEKISGKHFDIQYFTDISEAIHVILEDMGITGTTAAEASETISGSLASLRSAWQNLVGGLARDDADLDMLINNVVDSAETALDNIIPVAEKAINGVAQLIDKLAPVVQEKLPPLIERVAPIISDAIRKIGAAVLPAVTEVGGTILKALFDAIVESAPGLIPVLGAVLLSPILNVARGIGGALGAVKTAIGGVTTALPGAATAMGEAATAGGSLIGVLGSIATAAGIAADAILIAYDVNAIKQAVEDWEQVGEDAHRAKWNEEATYLDNYVKLYDEKGKEVADKFAMMVTGIDTTAMGFEEAQEALSRKVEENWSGVATNIGEGLMGGLEYYFGKDGKGGGFWGLVSDGFSGVVSGVKGMLGISSPSKVFNDIGVNIMQGLQNGITSKEQSVFDRLRNIARAITDTFKKALRISSPSKVMEELGGYTIDGLVNGLKGGETDVTDTMAQIAGDITDGDYMGEIGALAEPADTIETMSFSTYTPDMVAGSSAAESAARDLNIVLELDGLQLARTIYRMNGEETQRVGVKLAGGYV